MALPLSIRFVFSPTVKSLRILGLSLLPFFSGCVLVSMHTHRPVELHVRERASGKPLANAKVEVKYFHPRTCGAPFVVVRIPPPVSGYTDAQGTLVLPLADYSFGGGQARVDGRTFMMDPDTIRHGGLAKGGHWKAWPKLPPAKPGEKPKVQRNIEMKNILEAGNADTRDIIWVTPVWISDPVEIQLTPKK